MINLDKTSQLFKYLFGIPKSIYVNFRLLPLSQAIKLPIIVSNKTKLLSLNGQVKLSKIKTGIIRIGFGGAEHIDYKYDRTILKIDGILNFHGRAKIGLGSKLIIYDKAVFTAGSRFSVVGDTMIVCTKKISIGDNARISWRTVIMDSDQHPILNTAGEIINESKEIIVGNNVWIGAGCFILKNTKIDNGCIIAANSTITKNFSGVTNSVLGGNSAKVLKTDIRWHN